MLLFAPPPQSYDIWRDPVWQFIGVLVAILFGIVAIASLIIAIRANRQQNKRKELSYQIEFDTPLVSVDEELKSDVEIRYRGSVVEDVSLVYIKVWNSGSLAVKREDYIEPITFEIAGRTVLSLRVICEPVGIIKAKDINYVPPNYVKLSPVLLNPADKTTPADTITLNILVSGQGEIKGSARIIDGKLIEFDPDKQQKTSRNLQFIGVISFLALFAALLVAILILAFTAPNLIFTTQINKLSREPILTSFGNIFITIFLLVGCLAFTVFNIYLRIKIAQFERRIRW